MAFDFTGWSSAGFPGAEIHEHHALTTHRACLLQGTEAGIHAISKRLNFCSKRVAEWATWTAKEFEGLHEAKLTTEDELWLLCRPSTKKGIYFQPVTCPNGERVAILSTPPPHRIGKKGRPRKGEQDWRFALAEPAVDLDGIFNIPEWLGPRRPQ